MSCKTLIIKTGALGDVLRTTPLLYVLEGDVSWVTKRECLPLLPVHLLKQAIEIEEAEKKLANQRFDLVLSLDEDEEAAKLATSIDKERLIGSFLDSNGRITYTDSSAEWFDMGLISKYGKQEADRLKLRNTKTWQEILFRMVGKEFKGEEYIINFRIDLNPKPAKKKPLIGIEARAGDRWPMKRWNKYDQLAELLMKAGYEVKFLQERATVQEYVKDISTCDLVVTGDTLALHIALALKLKVVAIFICTSPSEIYDYGRMVKVINPMLDKAFYKTEYVQEMVEAVSLQEVYEATIFLLEKNR